MRNRLSTASTSLLVSILVATSVTGCATDSAFSEDEPEPYTVAPFARVFVPPLPECPRDREAIPVRYAGKALLGKSVAFRGVLTLDPGRSCRCGHCPADEWRVVDAEGRVYDFNKGRPATALLISLPVLLPGDDLGSPDLDVIATGVLQQAEEDLIIYYKQFLLEDAEVCRVEAGSSNHSHPFQHAPRTQGICRFAHE